MMSKRCYYEVLGIPKDANSESIKRAYRKLAMRFHPDRNPDDPAAEDRFKEASEAYGVLSDPERRTTYDRFGHDGVNGHGFNGFSAGGFDDIFAHFGDILGDLFGHGGHPGASCRRGANLHAELEISFEEAFGGTKKDVTFERVDLCGGCEGTGARPGSKPQRCGSCQGSGRIARQQGFFLVQTTCPVCQGAGAIIKDRCPDCKGEGTHRVQRTLSIKVPAGVDDGTRLRASGEGDVAGPGLPRGDLAICVRVAPHPVFQREGADVFLHKEIPFSLAALGGELTVDTLHGAQSIDVPPGTRSGTVVRLRNRGMPRVNELGYGDELVTLDVVVPGELTGEQATLLARLRETGL
ncbi:MAG: molecular chaperone DnaJ [Deltaproteobacteria bacterium]|nr:MAG: molecular chaperone DnaJ [Deltaproteobacteria bacterium]